MSDIQSAVSGELFASEAFAQLPGQLALDTDQLPRCAFCDAPDADDVYREEDCPPAPCCTDEDACHLRVLGATR